METIITAETNYDKTIERIRNIVEKLNEALGFDTTNYRNPQVTFGYIGNLAPGYDDRHWMIFLPHPGRVGSSGDSIGGFATGDIDGARRTLASAGGALRLARWNKGRA